MMIKNRLINYFIAGIQFWRWGQQRIKHKTAYNGNPADPCLRGRPARLQKEEISSSLSKMMMMMQFWRSIMDYLTLTWMLT